MSSKYLYNATKKDSSTSDYFLVRIDGVVKRITLADFKNSVKSIPLRSSFIAAYYDEITGAAGAVRTDGSFDIANDYDFCLIDTDAVTDATTIKPVCKLYRNNILRSESGEFAPVVCVKIADTSEEANEDLLDPDVWEKNSLGALDNKVTLYNEDKSVIYSPHGFDAIAWWNKCKNSKILIDGAYDYERKLYYDKNGVKTEVKHVVRPWETTKTSYTIGVARSTDVYIIDGVMNASNTRRWYGIFKSPCTFDGIVIDDRYKVARTAISPCPCTTIGGKTRNFFYLFEGEGNCQSSKGQNNICTMFFNNRTYPRVNDANQPNNMTWARANNKNTTAPYPCAEGGWHALDAFILTQELKHTTRYIHNKDLFGSGISSNDNCTNEETLYKNGGVRYKESGSSAWSYAKWSDSRLCYENQTHNKINFTTLLNLEHPKEQCMESQIAASMLNELNVSDGIRLKVYGGVYWQSKVKTEGLNTKVYKSMTATLPLYAATGLEKSYDIECVLRMSLTDGVSLSGDIFAYSGGGCEIVGTCVNPQNGSSGNAIDIYLCNDQTKWVNDGVTSVAKGSTFKCETDKNYIHQGHNTTNLADGYSKQRMAMTPYKIAAGGGINTFDCSYQFTRNVWSYTTVGNKARVAVRFRGNATNGSCSPRLLTATNTASSTNRLYGCLAQWLIE